MSAFCTLTALFMHRCEEENTVAAWHNKPRISVLYLNSIFTLHTSHLQLKPFARNAVSSPPVFTLIVGMPGGKWSLHFAHYITGKRGERAGEMRRVIPFTSKAAEGNEECPSHFRLISSRASSRLRLTQTTWQSSCKWDILDDSDSMVLPERSYQ